MSTSLRVILFVASLCVFFFIMKKIKKAKSNSDITGGMRYV